MCLIVLYVTMYKTISATNSQLIDSPTIRTECNLYQLISLSELSHHHIAEMVVLF